MGGEEEIAPFSKGHQMADRDEQGRFLPGWKGGPGRPPKGEALTDILRTKVDKEAIADKLLEIAMEKGDLAALKYIYDRLDGRPVETVNQNVLAAPKVVEIVHRDSEDDADTGDIEVVEE